MASMLEKIYKNSPIFIQNLMVTGQGLVFRRHRFNQNFYDQLSSSISRSSWPKMKLEEYQVSAAREFLFHAAQHSPYWKQRFLDHGCDPKAFSCISDIRGFPVLEKTDLRTRTSEIAATVPNPEKLKKAHTSGTTGSPIHVAYTPEDVASRQAFLYRMFALFNIKPMARSVRFSGHAIFPNADHNRRFWRMNWAANQMLMSSYHLHPDNLDDYVNKLRDYKPELIDGFPSSIFVLARHVNQRGFSGEIRPKAIMTTAETLEDYQKEEIAQAFGGCPVINQYASSEGAPFITADTNGELVVNIDSGIFEFVKPGTEDPAEPGEIAEMLVTSFNTHAYPLIRYRIGDTVLLPKTPRRSQVWDMPVVERILGRQDDILFTPSRGYIGSLAVFRKAPSTIRESQIVQVAPTKFLLNVVPDREAGYQRSDLEAILQEMRLRLGEVEVEVRECDSIPRGANGKLRVVIGLPSDERASS